MRALAICLYLFFASQVQAEEIATPTPPQDMVLKVQAKKTVRKKTSSTSSNEIHKEQIHQLPQGENIALPKLLATTSAGIVQGAFGQTFIRGNHANIQYQIDGVQLPESPSNTFGEAFSPRNIDHMEVITGGIPAEYGERLSAVVNIVTKSGPETPGGTAEVGYGSYNTYAPWAVYGGTNESGKIRYFTSVGYKSTDRGLDTPQPLTEDDQSHGGRDAVHDKAVTHNEFAKIDWQKDNSNRFTWVISNSSGWFQIPNYPTSFSSSDTFFDPNHTDPWGNGPFNYAPANTDDTQTEQNTYTQVVWNKRISDTGTLQIAPYYKYSYIGVSNDPTNDLAAGFGSSPITGAQVTSFSENRTINNFGIKADLSERPDDSHLVKTGVQIQDSRAEGTVNVTSGTQGGSLTSSSDDAPTTFRFESIYVQDDYTITKALSLNAGLRYDAIQTVYGQDQDTSDALLQPRVGLNYLITDSTKLHLFYGKLFQPAPAENLRDTFVQVGGGNALASHEIRAEKDDYYEAGVTQQWGEHSFDLTYYYKEATDQLDDAQLLTTSIAQPYNFSSGYATGVEFSAKGRLNPNWSDFFNYTYSVAKGKGASGGLFAFPAGKGPGSDYQYLDHVQVRTANAGVVYERGPFTWALTGLYGSGLRTGVNNSRSLPEHFTYDTTFSYRCPGDHWFSGIRTALDILNITDNAYPISIANGYNGSHYAAGRTYYLRLAKDF